jgi:hypothetical protein
MPKIQPQLKALRASDVAKFYLWRNRAFTLKIPVWRHFVLSFTEAFSPVPNPTTKRDSRHSAKVPSELDLTQGTFSSAQGYLCRY